jgi:hypothetical protein
LPLRFISYTNADIERVTELCFAHALELGAPSRFNFLVFSSVGSFAAASICGIVEHFQKYSCRP